MNAYRPFARLCLRAAPLMLVLALTACGGGSKSASPDESKAAPAPGTVKLAYGISFQVPEGWQIDGMITPDQATNAVLDQRVAAGERVMLASLYRPASTPEGKNGIAAIFLVDASKEFPPQAQAQAFTPDDLQNYANAILNRDKEEAKKAKAQSNLLSWNVTKSIRDGMLTLTHKGEARRPDGKLAIYDVNIYLSNGKGVGLKTLTDPAVPGNQQQVDTFVNSVRVSR